MKLPYDFQRLCDRRMDKAALKDVVLERRTVIRYHRDQKGDHRCWLDDYKVHCMLEDWGPYPRKLPEFERMMETCKCFFVLRQAKEADPLSEDAILDSANWDDDLMGLSAEELFNLLFEIQQAIHKHRSIPVHLRTLEDDRELYSVLPEKIPADFRLPPEEEFLGEAKAPCAGCRSFWRSHQGCPSDFCSLDKWGPCIPKITQQTESAARD